jgi:hypothetical protein
MDPVLFKNVFEAVAGLSLGAAFYALAIHLTYLRRDFWEHIGFVFVKLAWLTTVGVVFAILIPRTEVPPSGLGYAWMAGMALGAVGFILVARRTRRRYLRP